MHIHTNCAQLDCSVDGAQLYELYVYASTQGDTHIAR